MRTSKSIKHAIARNVRSIGILRQIRRFLPIPGDRVRFENSAQYWKERYKSGGDSGEGSYGPLARYKATFINDFCQQHRIESAIEFGCGDGNQASLLNIDSYLGIDISEECIKWAKERLDRPGWKFLTLGEYHQSAVRRCELALSLDVVYHLVEDEIYHSYLNNLFESSSRFVLIYASNFEHFDPNIPHVRHRKIVGDIHQLHSNWRLLATEKNPYSKEHDSQAEYGSFADFHVFERLSG